jgi:hypothetical protein
MYRFALIMLSIVVSTGAACGGLEAPADAATADASWLAALTGNDPSSAAAALDDEFEWTDAEGRTARRDDAVARLPALAAALQGETGVQRYDYGHVHVVTSAREETRLMRVWALRPDGWRLLGAIETRLATGATPFAASGAATGDCDNPCRTMPYEPTSENARQIAAIFQQLKVDEWHPNPTRWTPYVLDDVYYVTETAQLSKADRVERLKALAATGEPSAPGDPVVSMRIHDLGDSAVMIAHHTPSRGGNPYYSLRVWAHRDGRWQLANTQQTVVRSGQQVPAS